MYKFSLLQTILLALPYIAIYSIYFYKIRDVFFIREPSYRKIDLYIYFISITIFLFLIWNSNLNDYQFLGLKLSQEKIFFNDKFITFLGITTAIVGWLYTVRTQTITNMRNHSINTIINTRLSEYYNQQIRQIDKVVKNKISFSYDDYKNLKPEE